MNFEINKGDPLWTLWAELFLLWKDFGNCHTQKDADDWYFASKELEAKYQNTTEYDLCIKVLLAMADVIDERMKNNDKQRGMQNTTENW